MSKKPLINILISIVVIVVVFFAYRFFFPGSTASQQTPSLETVGVAADGSLEPQDEFLQLLLSLQALEFKTDVFDTIHKGGFQDFTVQLVPKTPGRPNPFAPIGSDARTGTVATSSPKSAKVFNP